MGPAQFKSITLYMGTNPLWSMNGTFSKEFTIGALAAGEFALSKIMLNMRFTAVREAPQYENDSHTIILGSEMVLLNITPGNNRRRLVRPLCEHSDYKYHIWLSHGDGADLYKFNTPDFLQGIFTILQAFNIDYTEFIIAAPIGIFPYDGRKTVQYYNIEGYPLPYLTNDPNETYNICEPILNPPGSVIPMEERLRNLRHDLLEYPTIATEPIILRYGVDAIMNEIPAMIIHIPPDADFRMTELYIGYLWDRYGNKRPESNIEEFLKRYA